MSQLTRVPVLFSGYINDGHLRALVPDGCFFKVDANNQVLLSREFSYLSAFAIFNEYSFKLTDDPIEPQKSTQDTKFHRLYMSLFNTSHMPNAQFETLNITRSAITELLENANLYTYSSKKLNIPIIDDSKIKYPIFIKTEMTSGKNDEKLSKLDNKQQLIERMSIVRSWSVEYEQFLKSNQPTFKFFYKPWVDIVEEYRIFVYRRKIVTVCPQKYWEIPTFDIDIADILLLQKTFVDLYEHDNYCIDVYRPHDKAALKFIEVNEWYNSGPGLLDYKEIKNVPCDTILYKYLVIG